jgi:hypothetical protein
MQGASNAMLNYKLIILEVIPNSGNTVFNVFFTINVLESDD